MGLYTSEEVRRHASYPGCVDVLVDVSVPYVNGTAHLVIPSISPSQVVTPYLRSCGTVSCGGIQVSRRCYAARSLDRMYIPRPMVSSGGENTR